MKRIVLFVIAVSILFSSLAYACTDFQIKAKDKSIVIGRSMEFPVDLKSNIIVVPRGQQFNVMDSKKVKGLSWTAKYGYLALNAYNIPDTYVEGLNEAGLAFEGLMYTGAVYQPVVAGKYIPLDKLGAWLMGNFATVAEVKAALATTNISQSEIKQLKDMGLHVAIHDAAGNNLVVEFIDGKANVYDNPNGVMTNRPNFEWQLTNLRNYVNLHASDAEDKMVNGIKIEPTGVGSGMLGLPGDWTPASRFVRVSYCVDAAIKPKDAKGAEVLAEHILNIVDIPMGVIKESPAPFVTMYGYAQWVLIKDLTNQVLYFKTYDNTAWKSVSLKKFDLSAGKPVKVMPVDSNQLSAIDVSGNFK